MTTILTILMMLAAPAAAEAHGAAVAHGHAHETVVPALYVLLGVATCWALVRDWVRR